MKLIFERSVKGKKCAVFPDCDVPLVTPTKRRQAQLTLPELGENEISRHYTALVKEVHGVNDGVYPLGSCTMKYNPKIDDEIASLRGFAEVHPLQEDAQVQGCLEVLYKTQDFLCKICGMDAVTLQPAAGAHGEFTALLLFKAYHVSRNDTQRTKIIVPDSAHGTNPASSTMAGFEVVNLPSGADGCIDCEALKSVVGPDTAGLMLTNPNTLGLFDKNITEICSIVHEAGGLCYYDGANLNAVMGIARPGDMGFDAVHVNLHKTFATPHGGGGPGSGPVGCKEFLADFLPGKQVVEKNGIYSTVKAAHSVGDVRSFNGNFLVIVRALTYMMTLGREGIPETSQNAVLNANYMRCCLSDTYTQAFDRICMHEFVISCQNEKDTYGFTTLDIAKALLDYGIHPPTIYFPLIVKEALMFEPTETESKSAIDTLVNVLIEIHRKAVEDPEWIFHAPHKTTIYRLDEVAAARNPKLAYEPILH
jgi:glycine dehydrogenase subunit 2